MTLQVPYLICWSPILRNNYQTSSNETSASSRRFPSRSLSVLGLTAYLLHFVQTTPRENRTMDGDIDTITRYYFEYLPTEEDKIGSYVDS